MSDTGLLFEWITDETIQEIHEKLEQPYKGTDLQPYIQREYPELMAILKDRDIPRLEAFVDEFIQELSWTFANVFINSVTHFLNLLHQVYMKDERPWLTKEVIRNVRQILQMDQNVMKENYNFIKEHAPNVIQALENEDVEAMKRVVNGLESRHDLPDIKDFEDLWMWLVKWASIKKKIGIEAPLAMPLIVIDCLVRGVVCRAVVDTGCDISSIVYSSAMHWLRVPDYQLDTSKATTSYGIGEVGVVGRVYGLTIDIKGRRFAFNFNVIESQLQYDVVLGIDFLTWNQCDIYCRDYSVYFGEKNFWIQRWPSHQYWEYCRWRDFDKTRQRLDKSLV